MSNDREFPRARVKTEVKMFRWADTMVGHLTEVSANGLFVAAKETLPEGTLLTLRLLLPGVKRAFTVLGRVVRTARGGFFTPPGMGIRFLDISAKDRELISAFVSEHAVEFA